MPFIFISYSHKDSEYANRLADSLEAKGLDVWIDERIDYGARWPHAIQEKLDKCAAFVVVMTPDSFDSERVQAELTRARRLRKPIFPLLLEGDVWLALEATLYVDVHGAKLPPPRFYTGLAGALSTGQGQAAPSTHLRERLRTELGELQRRYDNLTSRIAAVDTDLGRALDSEHKLNLEERRAELASKRDEVSVRLEQIDRDLAEQPASERAAPEREQRFMTPPGDAVKDEAKPKPVVQIEAALSQQATPVKPADKTESVKPVEKPEPAKPTSKQADVEIQVFLSYAPGDEAVVVRLYDWLASVGLKPWMDKRDILPGEQRQESLLRAARKSQFYLACLSSNSVDYRGLLQPSLRTGLDVLQEKLAGDIYLIPVLLEDCDVPEELSAYQAVDLFDDAGWILLLRAFDQRIAGVGGKLPAALQTELERSPTARVAEAKPAPQTSVKPDQRRFETPPGVHKITEPIRMELVRVPAGEFLMGSDPARDKGSNSNEQPQHPLLLEKIDIRKYLETNTNSTEQPQHPLRLEEFYIGKYPVTNSQYNVFVKATKREAPSHWEDGAIPSGKEEHPVVRVTWRDAVAFSQWLAEVTEKPFRLPTEAEWEKAASWDVKARQKRIWPWGDTFDAAKCNTSEGRKRATTPVGGYSPAGDSPCDAADMVGNVWEWTSSLWGKDESRPEFGYPYDSHDGRENQAAPKDVRRVLRGGSFNDFVWVVRCTFRFYGVPNYRGDALGFRVCSTRQAKDEVA